MGPQLHEVFGINSNYRAHSYVDRGGLDDRLRYLLGKGRHIVIHGDSKHGKSWLRSRILAPDSHILVQCRPETSVEGVFKEALGQLGVNATIKQTDTMSL